MLTIVVGVCALFAGWIIPQPKWAEKTVTWIKAWFAKTEA